ncbi:hypothetical protein [Luteimonas sp. TWI1437]|uniref:hypothetical protein n=1 Tax=unclassified Luteimonas TaxID=2629088 RepID=UPI00320AD466
MSKTGKLLTLAALLFALTACASSHVLVGTARDPIGWEDVKVYIDPPASYENVALLEASDLGANGFSAQSRMNKVISRLKAEAADLGANGILLQGFDTQITGSVSSGFGNVAFSGNSAFVTGTGYSAAQTSKVGRAMAIYVPVNALVAPPAAVPSIEVEEPAAAPTPPPAAAVPALTQPAVEPSSTPSAAPATTPPPAGSSNWRGWGRKGD